MAQPRADLARSAFVYIVTNKSRSLYVGITTDLIKRFEQHKTGAYPSAFTARYRFTKLVYYESASDLAAAAKREKEIKGWRREKKVRLIESQNPRWLDLTPDIAALFR